jgi:hypothetical protein
MKKNVVAVLYAARRFPPLLHMLAIFIIQSVVVNLLASAVKPWVWTAHNRSYTIPPPDSNYSAEHFWDMVEPQGYFIEDVWRVDGSWANPSMTYDPVDLSRIFYVYRVLTKSKYERTNYCLLPYNGKNQWQPMNGFRRLVIGVQNEWGHDLFGEDVRIFSHNYDLYVYYNFHMSMKIFYYTRVLYKSDDDSLFVHNLSTNVRFQGIYQKQHEKNWFPFEYCPHCIFKHGILSPAVFQQYHKDHPNEPIVRDSLPSPVYPFEIKNNFSHIQNAQLYFVYAIQPHVTVRFYKTMNYDEEWAEMIFVTEFTDFEWPWGEMRGGTSLFNVCCFFVISFLCRFSRFTN